MGEKVFPKRAFQQQKNIVLYYANAIAPPAIECGEVRQMFWHFLMGFLAAFGALCAIWVLFGLVIPGSVRCHVAVCCPKGREIAVIRRFCRLRELGLIHSELTVLDSGLNRKQQHYIHKKYPFITFRSREGRLTGQGRGRASDDAGTGDLAGNHRCGGLSEL